MTAENGSLMVDGSITSGHLPKSPSTQEAHPWKAVVRTFVAAGAGVLVAWLARTIGIDLAGLEGPIVDSATAAVWAFITGLVQWLLTHPKLLPFWESIGLGTGVEKE